MRVSTAPPSLPTSPVSPASVPVTPTASAPLDAVEIGARRDDDTPYHTPIASLPVNAELAKYLSVPGIGSPAFGDEGRLLYTSNESGSAQLWSLDPTTGEKTQLTRFSEPLDFYQRLDDGRFVLGKGAGGNERTQLFIMQAEGGEPRQLTNDPTTIHQFGDVSADGKTLLYSANARNKAVFDIHTLDIETGESRMVFEGDGSIAPVCFSPDGTKVLYSKSNTNLDADLHILDLATGTSRCLTKHEGEAGFDSVRWTADGITCLTNRDREFFAPARLDPESGAVTYLETRDHDAEALAFTPDGRYRITRYNEDGYSRFHVVDLQTPGAEGKVANLPDGVVRSMSLSPDGQSVVFAFSSPTSNAGLHTLDLATGETRQVLQGGLNGLDPSSFVREQLVSYETFDGRQIPAFLYTPREGGETKPAIVNVHGGPEAQSRPEFSGLTQYLVKNGYTVLVPNIRGSLGYGKTFSHLDDIEKRPDAIEDVAAGARYLSQSGAASADRIAVMGGSYGGYMTLAQLVFHPEVWAAGCDIVGMSNMLTFMEHTGPWRKHLRTPEYGDPEIHRQTLVDISPITHVDNLTDPLMVIQGANDPRVPQIEADQIVRETRENGNETEYLLFPDEGHGLNKMENRVRGYSAMVEFFDTHLKSEGA